MLFTSVFAHVTKLFVGYFQISSWRAGELANYYHTPLQGWTSAALQKMMMLHEARQYGSVVQHHE
jgi:hypothetical protein